MGTREITKLYKDYCIGQDAEKIRFIQTVGDEPGCLYIFQIFDTSRKSDVYTIVNHSTLINSVTELGAAETLEEALEIAESYLSDYDEPVEISPEEAFQHEMNEYLDAMEEERENWDIRR